MRATNPLPLALAALLMALFAVGAAPAHAQEDGITEIVFAEGATSASFSGTLSGEPDIYTFQARAGQQLAVGVLGAEGQAVPVVAIIAPDDTEVASDVTAVDAELTATGQYVMTVATDAEDDVPYTFTISIVTPDDEGTPPPPTEEGDPPADEDEDEEPEDPPPAGDDAPACDYVVEPGDTLFSIARRFNTTVDALQAANNLMGTTILAGTALNVACLPDTTPGPEGTRYTVQPGDTLFRIALRFGVTVEELRAANSLPGDFIAGGQQLVIPGQQQTAEPGGVYVVQPGDTLFSLAQRFGTTVQAIRQANNLQGDALLAGQSLTLPSAVTAAPETVTVQPGDTLTSIAAAFGVTVADLRAANTLTADTIQPGTVLTIPTRAVPTPGTYTVQPGDTLFSIAARFNTPLDALISANNIVNPDRINVGDVLTLP